MCWLEICLQDEAQFGMSKSQSVCRMICLQDEVQFGMSKLYWLEICLQDEAQFGMFSGMQMMTALEKVLKH